MFIANIQLLLNVAQMGVIIATIQKLKKRRLDETWNADGGDPLRHKQGLDRLAVCHKVADAQRGQKLFSKRIHVENMASAEGAQSGFELGIRQHLGSPIVFQNSEAELACPVNDAGDLLTR